MLEMDVMMVMRCRDTGRVFMYGSQDASHLDEAAGGVGVFDLKKAKLAIEHWEALKKRVIVFSDSDYSKFSQAEDVRVEEDRESDRDQIVERADDHVDDDQET